MAPAREDVYSAVVESCRACRDLCDQHLSELATSQEGAAAFRDTVTCVALLSLIADRIEVRLPCPSRLLELAIELAEGLPNDGDGCVRACRAGAESISDLVAAGYDRATPP